MVDTPDALQQEGTDLQAEWDRLDASDAGGQHNAPAADEQPAANEPDDQGQASRPPADPAAATPAGNEPQPNDIWASAPAELRTAFEAERGKWEQSARSAGGRAQAESRRNAELLAELATYREKGAPAKPEEEAPAVTDEQKQQLREEFPDVAAPLLDAIGALEKRVADLTAAGASQAEQRQAADALSQERHFADEEQRLSEKHSDWQAVAAQPGFADWVKTQPRMIQEALARNAEKITDADEAIDIIGRYKTATAKPDALPARREAQMAGSRIPTGRTTAPTPSTTTDAEAEWKRLEALDARREAQAKGSVLNR